VIKFSPRLAISAVALAYAGPVLAQAGTSTQAADGAIIATAQRRAERTQDVPISITAISGDTLSQANVHQLGDIAKLSPATRLDYTSNFVQFGDNVTGTKYLKQFNPGDFGAGWGSPAIWDVSLRYNYAE
jgi:hypothetical protein